MSLYTFDTCLLNKYGYHTANMTHTAILLKGIWTEHFADVYQLQATVTVTLHIIAKYVPETIMPLKCQICATHYN